MSWVEAVVPAFVQGLTEFIPGTNPLQRLAGPAVAAAIGCAPIAFVPRPMSGGRLRQFGLPHRLAAGFAPAAPARR